MTDFRTFRANDGEELTYQVHGQFSGPNRTILILIHGFTGSSQYFARNFATLSRDNLVIAPDLRGHGMSTKARHGYHVARLAADLRDLINELNVQHPRARYIAVGCSLGAAVLWSYSELFDSKDFVGMVFVDQAPLQDYIPGSWSIDQGNYGVHDAASLAAAQATLKYAPDEFYRGLIAGCLGYRFQPTAQEMSISQQKIGEDEEFFINISRQGDSWWFGKLLANHTAYDHRDTIKNLIKRPCMVLAAERSGSFPVQGLFATVQLINEGKEEAWAIGDKVDSGMFYEQPEQFNADILKFCERISKPDFAGFE